MINFVRKFFIVKKYYFDFVFSILNFWGKMNCKENYIFRKYEKNRIKEIDIY